MSDTIKAVAVSRYNQERDFLKVVAIVAMTLDHLSTVFLADDSLLYVLLQNIGNWTIIIMCYFLAQGLFHTRSIRRYLERLITWALISQIPFTLIFGFQLNVLFTLFISLLIIYLLDNKGLLVSMTALALLTPVLLISDWNILAPVFTIIFYYASKQNRAVSSIYLIPGTYLILSVILYPYLDIFNSFLTAVSIFTAATIVSSLSAPLEKNGKGRVPSLFFYIYYPAHMLAIYVVTDTFTVGI